MAEFAVSGPFDLYHPKVSNKMSFCIQNNAEFTSLFDHQKTVRNHVQNTVHFGQETRYLTH